MFKELHPIAQSAPLMMSIVAQGEKLRVTVQQKSTRKGAPLSLSIVATAEELDAELPAAIGAAAGELATVKPVAEQVKDQVDATKAAKQKRATHPDGKKKKAKPARPAPKVKAKPRKPAPAAKTKIELPGKTAPKAGKKPTREAASAPGNRATAQECLAEFRALYAKHGNALTREKFLEHAKTARSFERRFGGWKKFVAAAGLSSTEPEAGDNDTRTLPLPLSGEVTNETAESAPPQPAPSQPEGPVAGPAAPADTDSATAQADPSAEASQQEDSGPAAAAESSVAMQTDESGLDALAKDYAESGYSSARPTMPATWPFPQPNRPSAQEEAPPLPPPARVVCTIEGKLLAGGHVADVKPGDEITIAGEVFRVVTENAEKIFVKAIAAPAPPPAPPQVRKIIDDEGDFLCARECNVALGEEIDLNGIAFKVVRMTDKAIFVEPAVNAAAGA